MIYGPTAPSALDLVVDDDAPGSPEAAGAAYDADTRDPLQGPEPAYEYARDDVYEAEPG